MPACLLEVVANAWDADAEIVSVEIEDAGDKTVIVIRDNGLGMTLEEVNQRFLGVGYKRRSDGRAKSERFRRDVMGRKGIGKLSPFSVADVVELRTVKGKKNLVVFHCCFSLP